MKSPFPQNIFLKIRGGQRMYVLLSGFPFFILLLFFAASIPGDLKAQSGNPPLYEPGIVYLRIRDTSSVSIRFDSLHLNTEPTVLNPVFAQFQVYDVQTPFAILGSSFDRCYRIFHSTVGQEDSLINILKLLPFVDFAERMPHDELDGDCPNMPSNPQANYYMTNVNACQAFDLHNWNNHPNAPRTLVAIVDDAVMTNHEDLEMHMSSGWDVAHNDNDPNPPFNTPFGNLTFFEHGTRVASVAGGDAENTLGVSSMGWFNDIMPVKCRHDATGEPGSPPSSYYDGVAWAAAHGAKVINMSWGSYRPSQMNYNVIVAASGGSILVGTAGNNNIIDPRYPGAYGEGATGQAWETLNSNLILSVANLASNGNKSPTSNFGSWVDVSSYGVSIRLADISHDGNANLNNQYVTDNGTSFSAPQVSALAGLMWSYHPNAGADEIINCILGTANPDIYDAAHPGNQAGTLGSGRIDAYAAMLCLAQTCTPAPIAAVTPSYPYVCPNTGTTLTANLGIAYQWSNGATTRSTTVTQAGTYSVTVTFQIGAATCTGTAQFTIAAMPAEVPVVQSGTHCASTFEDKMITIGAPAFTYLWVINGGAPFSGGNTYSIISNTGYDYAVTMTDVWGCPGLTETIEGKFEQYPPVIAKITPTENSAIPDDGIICGPAPVTLTASGGVSYEWGAGLGTNTSINVNPTTTTIYDVTVTDVNGCTAWVIYTVQVIPNFIDLQVTENSGAPNDRWLCEPGATVTIAAVGCPGNTFTYQWSTGETTASITKNPLMGTQYKVTVTDQNGSSVVRDVYIFVVDGNTVSLTVTENSGIPNDATICQGASALLSAFPTGKQYQWSTGQTTAAISVSPSGSTIYTVTVTLNLCSYVRTQAITVIPTPTATITITENSGTPNDGIICPGTSVVLSAATNTPGATYLWSHNLGTNPVVSTTPLDPITTYYVTVTSANGCTAVASLVVSIGSNLSVFETSGIPHDRILCASGAAALIEATAASGTTYLWSTGATASSITVNPSATTTYSVTTTNGGGCTAVQSVTITVMSPTIALSLKEDSGISNDGIICSGTPVLIQATIIPGATYLWSTLSTEPEISVSPLVNQTFSVTISTGNGCSYVREQAITVTPSPFVLIKATENSVLPNDGILCPGYTEPVILTAHATTGVTYIWNTGATTAQITVPVLSATYSVTVTSAEGCTGSAVFNVVVGIQLSAVEGNPPKPSDGLICEGSVVTITAYAGNSSIYNWSNGTINASSITISPTQTTTYTVTATDLLGGCVSTASITITVVQPPSNLSISLSENSGTPNDGIICPGSTAMLWVNDPQPNYTYLWNTGQTTDQIEVAPTSTQAYQVTVTIGNACTRVLTRFIDVIPHAPVDIYVAENSGIPNDRTICLGSQAMLTASDFPGETYQWSGGLGNSRTVSASPTVTTTYTVTLTSALSGCTTTAAVTITVIPPVGIAVTENSDIPNDGIICLGTQATLTADNLPGAAYQWSNGLGNGPTVVVSPAATTTYTVSVTTAAGCPSTATATVTVENCGQQTFTCPCTGTNTLNLNASPNGTLYSTLGLPNTLDPSVHNGCIAVIGRLIIDRDVSILSCPNLRMQPCSEIVVQGPAGNAPARHLTMEHNNIYGCEQMWRSVTVQPGAKLTFRHNTVADAQHANWINPSSWLSSLFTTPTQVDIQFNNYVRNHVGLNIPGNGGGFTGGQLWQTPFIGNDLLCTGPAAPLLPACPLDVLDNYEPVFGYAGATVSGANFNIGVPGGSFNTFSNLRNGVVAQDVFLNVDNAAFTNMVGFLNFDPPSLDFSRGVGVAGNGCFASVRDSRFNQAGHAMFLNGGLNTVLRNTTTQVRLGLETRSPIGLWVRDKNDFGFLDFGIRARELAGSPNFFLGGGYRIDDNDFFTQDVQTDINGDWAIQLENTASTVMADNFARVSRNRVRISDQIAGGLQITNQDAWSISDNRLDFTAHPQSVVLTGVGIDLANSRYNRLYGNELNDVAGASPGGTTGFFVHSSVGNIFCCNSTNRNGVGSLFTGTCNGTDFRTTTMASHDFSLWVTSGTVIGKQRSATMTNSNLFGCDSGLAANDNVQSVVLDSEFFVTDLTCPRHPQSVSPTTGWFTEIVAGDVECGSDPQCSPVTYPRGRNIVEGSDLSIAQGLYPSTPRYAALHWEGSRDLYARLKQYPADMLGQSAAVDAFYTAAEQGSAIKSFYDAEVAIAAVREAPAAWGQAFTTATDSINAIEQRAKSVLVSLANVSTRADSLSVYWQSEAVRSGIVVPMATVLEKQHQLDSLRRARAAAALPAVLVLPASGILQSNRKSVLRIYLEVTATGAKHLTAAQFATVKAIAEQCALEGGSAVYTARALYQMNEKRHFDDLAICGENQERSTGAKRPATRGVALWPNPSTGRLQVFVPGVETEQSVHLRVTDISGRVILEQKLTTPDGNLLLDGSLLAPGTHFCQVRTASEVFAPVKFVISL